MDYSKELKAGIEACKLAMEVIRKYYANGFNVEIKSDNSPVTDADKESDEVILAYLKKLFPNYAYLTEETPDDLSRLNQDLVWIIDPLDGTKDFVARDDEFTVNIALAYKHKAVVGIVGVPATDEIYYASFENGAYVLRNGETKKLHVNDKTEELTCLKSVFHHSDYEASVVEKHKDKIVRYEKKGSSLKACDIAEGKAEISYRFGPGTKEWDTAAFQVIVEEAGGFVLKFDGNPIMYNREDVHNRDGYIIVNRKENILL